MTRIVLLLRKVPWSVWCFAGFLLLCSSYEYGRVLHSRPLPHHLWRQCNSLSLTQEFYSSEWNILEPGVQSLIADDLTTGKSAGEFPLLYYVVAMIWKVVGQSEFAYRVLMLMLHAWGTWALFRCVQEILRDGAWAVMLSLFFFTVPAVVYFAISFITDVPALDLVLIGMLPLILYIKDGERIQLISMTIAFTCAILIKLTAAILPLAILLVLVIVRLLPGRYAWPGLDRWKATHVSTAIALALLVSGLWVHYSFSYNALHGAEYSYQGTWAYWDLSSEELFRAKEFGSRILIYQLFDTPAYVAILTALIYCAWRSRKAPVALGLLLVTLLSGVALYLALWFVTFDNHDYYFIAPLVLPMTILISALWLMKQYDPLVFLSPWTKGAFLILLGYHSVYAMNNHQMRTHGSSALNVGSLIPVYHASELEHWSMTQYWSMSGLIDIEPVARAAGIRRDDLIVAMPDESVCSALYLSGQRGFNEFGGLHLDSAQVARRVEKGAKYLYLLEYNEAMSKALGGWLDVPVLEHNGVRIYDLRRSP